jgi:hypothetical protein
MGPCSDYINEREDKKQSLKNLEKVKGGHKHHRVSKAEKAARSTFPKDWKMPEREIALKEARERVTNPSKPCGVGNIKVGNTG